MDVRVPTFVMAHQMLVRRSTPSPDAISREVRGLESAGTVVLADSLFLLVAPVVVVA